MTATAAASPLIHDCALVETHEIGPGTRIWAFAHVMAGAVIGAGCNICDYTHIEGGVVLGDRVTVKAWVFLWDGIAVADDVFIGPRVAFATDRAPCRRRPLRREPTVIAAGATIGAGAVLSAGVRIGARAMVGAGSVVTEDVPPGAVVVGNPARIVRMLDAR